jgi:hypothetical protein
MPKPIPPDNAGDPTVAIPRKLQQKYHPTRL